MNKLLGICLLLIGLLFLGFLMGSAFGGEYVNRGIADSGDCYKRIDGKMVLINNYSGDCFTEADMVDLESQLEDRRTITTFTNPIIFERPEGKVHVKEIRDALWDALDYIPNNIGSDNVTLEYCDPRCQLQRQMDELDRQDALRQEINRILKVLDQYGQPKQ